MSKQIKEAIKDLLSYSIDNKIISDVNLSQAKENLENLFKVNLDDFSYEKKDYNLNEILKPLIDYGYEIKFYDINTLDEKDKFEAYIFDLIMQSPIQVKNMFKRLMNISSSDATNYLYKLSSSTNYIKTSRLNQNIHFKYLSSYGNLEITINLAKPEKDPKEIALLKNRVEPINLDIPKCVLCKENEQNYHNARKNLRIIPITLSNELWHFQYSPYLYFNEHCIILHDDHRPMKISAKTIDYLIDFVLMFDHYFIGSNADLPIVGGSILSHDHFQGGKHKFPIHYARQLKEFITTNDILIQTLNWPLSTIRLESKDKNLIVLYYKKILKAWKNYNNEKLNIKSHSLSIEHNTLNPILRYENHVFKLDIILRNNLTTNEYPLELFHPHQDLWHIKKENIGLIEAMGLAILPGRLISELNIILDGLKNNKKELPMELEIHKDWYKYLYSKKDTIKDIGDLYNEVGMKFEQVLNDSGVFKLNEEGISAFNSFVEDIIY